MNHTAPDPESSAEHPDELFLAGWSEGRLLEFERVEVEAHLADCRACRALVAALGREPAPARRASRAIPWRAALVAAAALFLLALLVVRWREPRALAPSLELALAGTRAGTFSDLRGAPLDTGELYVGVRLREDAWVRLIAVDEAGGVHEVPLDPEGAASARFAGGSDHVFGPYPTALEGELPVLAVLALVSHERIEWSAVEGTGWRGELGARELARLGRALEAATDVRRLR